jgi:hypothetical protein
MSEAAPVVYMCKYIYANICNYNRRLGNSHRLQKSSKIVAKSKILGTGGSGGCTMLDKGGLKQW